MKKNTKLRRITKWKIFGMEAWFLKQKGIFYRTRREAGKNYINFLEKKKESFLGEEELTHTLLTAEIYKSKIMEERRLQTLCEKYDQTGQENVEPRMNMYISNSRKKIAEYGAELEGYNAIFEDRKRLVTNILEESKSLFLTGVSRKNGKEERCKKGEK